MQSVNITTNVVISNTTKTIQHHVIKFVSDLRGSWFSLGTLGNPNLLGHLMSWCSLVLVILYLNEPREWLIYIYIIFILIIQNTMV
jgi:hypothetical protein